jgi:preprotein translocase subunit SecG
VGIFFVKGKIPMYYSIAIVVEVIIGILLMLAVLMQSSKGGGLAGSFGGGNLGTVFGVRRTSDFLTKLTQWLAGIFMLLALVINLWLLPRGEQKQESVIQSGPPPAALPPSQQAPSAPIPGSK